MQQRAPKTMRWSSKTWWLVICFVCSVFYVAFQGGKTSLMLLIIISCLTIYLVLGRWSGIASAKGKREITGLSGGSKLQSGSELKVDIYVDIPGIWPIPYVTVKDRLTKIGGQSQEYEGTFVPDWRRRGVLTYVTPQLARGLYRYETITCVTRDIFGLFEHSGIITIPLSFGVLPRTVQLTEWRELHTMFKGHRQQSSIHGSHRETTQINGVREYIYGDRLARVHWNATARTGQWKSKEFERETLPKLTIVLDRHTKSYRSQDEFELAVSVAASLVQFSASRNISCGFLSVSGTQMFFEPPGGYDARKRIENHLIEVQMDPKGDPMRLLRDRARIPSSGGLVVLISPRYGEPVKRLMKWLNVNHIGACQMWVDTEEDGKAKEDWVAALRSAGIVAYRVQRLEELPILLGGQG